MAMLERSERQQIVSSTGMIVLVVAAILFAGLMVYHANQVSDAAGPITEGVNFGPFTLLEMGKKPLEGGGYEASFAFGKGALGYMAFWAVMFAGISLMRLHLRSARQRELAPTSSPLRDYPTE